MNVSFVSYIPFFLLGVGVEFTPGWLGFHAMNYFESPGLFSSLSVAIMTFSVVLLIRSASRGCGAAVALHVSSCFIFILTDSTFRTGKFVPISLVLLTRTEVT